MTARPSKPFAVRRSTSTCGSRGCDDEEEEEEEEHGRQERRPRSGMDHEHAGQVTSGVVGIKVLSLFLEPSGSEGEKIQKKRVDQLPTSGSRGAIICVRFRGGKSPSA